MRRMLSLQASRALFSSFPRVIVVVATLAVYFFAAQWSEPYVSWWVVALVGLMLLAGLQLLGSLWLERDVLRAARDDPEE